MSAKPKPKTPYQRVLEDFKAYRDLVVYPDRNVMWRYPKGQLDQAGGWRLGDLWERVSAAQQMRWRVELVADDTGLTVRYVAPLPTEPWYL